MAAESPWKVLSAIADGADQAKFSLPRFLWASKRDKGQGMKQKVMGFPFQGGICRKEILFLFTAADNIPGGANLTIDCLCRAVFVLIDKRRAMGIEKFPQELYLQIDNTSKDNKNRYIFAFCELLGHYGLLSRVFKLPTDRT